MKKILGMLFLGVILSCGCSKEKSAEALYQKAHRLEQEHNYTQAIKYYETIATKYAQTIVASSIQQDIQKAQKAQLEYYITENKPKVIAAVRNYSFPAVFDENTMKQVELVAKSVGMPLDNEPRVDRELKATAIGICILSGYLATPCLIAERENKYTWDAKSTDNEIWTVTMKSKGNKILTASHKSHTSILKVNLTNQTLALTRREDCGSFAPDIEERLSKSKRKINWEKECVVPLKLEGVLK